MADGVLRPWEGHSGEAPRRQRPRKVHPFGVVTYKLQPQSVHLKQALCHTVLSTTNLSFMYTVFSHPLQRSVLQPYYDFLAATFAGSAVTPLVFRRCFGFGFCHCCAASVSPAPAIEFIELSMPNGCRDPAESNDADDDATDFEAKTFSYDDDRLDGSDAATASAAAVAASALAATAAACCRTLLRPVVAGT